MKIRKYARDALPPISRPSSSDNHVLVVDAKAVVQFVDEALQS